MNLVRLLTILKEFHTHSRKLNLKHRHFLHLYCNHLYNEALEHENV